MNKFLKVLIAILGAINVTFSLFIPIAIALLIINIVNLTNFNAGLLIVFGISSSLYRAIKFLVVDN
ncbi:hypothetical protein LCGC14_0509530 [marine sediment metagenome]|uniref:Uncharacterized protein n=1 Tax=marine sediment metagenome TaxID=412755 RepID=A0A0F9SK29_9ZZZZ